MFFLPISTLVTEALWFSVAIRSVSMDSVAGEMMSALSERVLSTGCCTVGQSTSALY